MTLPVRAPFHLEATVRLLQRRPSNRVDVWDGRRYRRVLPAEGGPFVCTVENTGSIDEPALELHLDPRPASRAAAAQLARALGRILGLDEEPGLALPGAAAPRLRELERALRGARPPRFPTLFEAFCRIVPYQQLTLDAGEAVAGRLVERFGRRFDTEGGPVWAFPEEAGVATAAPDAFAGIGLSQAKVASLRSIGAQLLDGSLSEEELERLPTEVALRRLQALPGIGPWSAALVLLRGLRRMDVFPAGDVGVQRGLGKLLDPRAPLAPIVEGAGNRRGYLYFYSLAAQLLERGLIHPAEPEEAAASAGTRTVVFASPRDAGDSSAPGSEHGAR